MNRKDVIGLYNRLLALCYWKNDWSGTLTLKEFISVWADFRKKKGSFVYDPEKACLVNGFFVYDGTPVVRFEPAIPKAHTYSEKAEYYEGRILAMAGL